MKYNVGVERIEWYSLEVEADSEGEAQVEAQAILKQFKVQDLADCRCIGDQVTVTGAQAEEQPT